MSSRTYADRSNSLATQAPSAKHDVLALTMSTRSATSNPADAVRRGEVQHAHHHHRHHHHHPKHLHHSGVGEEYDDDEEDEDEDGDYGGNEESGSEDEAAEDGEPEYGQSDSDDDDTYEGEGGAPGFASGAVVVEPAAAHPMASPAGAAASAAVGTPALASAGNHPHHGSDFSKSMMSVGARHVSAILYVPFPRNEGEVHRMSSVLVGTGEHPNCVYATATNGFLQFRPDKHNADLVDVLTGKTDGAKVFFVASTLEKATNQSQHILSVQVEHVGVTLDSEARIDFLSKEKLKHCTPLHHGVMDKAAQQFVKDFGIADAEALRSRAKIADGLVRFEGPDAQGQLSPSAQILVNVFKVANDKHPTVLGNEFIMTLAEFDKAIEVFARAFADTSTPVDPKHFRVAVKRVSFLDPSVAPHELWLSESKKPQYFQAKLSLYCVVAN